MAMKQNEHGIPTEGRDLVPAMQGAIKCKNELLHLVSPKETLAAG
jgi:hypothetical protein